MAQLVEIALNHSHPLAPKGCRLLEFCARHNPELLKPYTTEITRAMQAVHHRSSQRCLAKIAELWMIDYSRDPTGRLSHCLKNPQKEQLTEICFTWLIGDTTVATKAHSITVLYYLGKEIPWIHPELTAIIELNYQAESAAYKARTRLTLKQIARDRKNAGHAGF